MPTIYTNANAVPKVMVSDTLAGVRNIPTHTVADNAICFQIGNTAAYDQAVAIWVFDGAISTADNGTTILKPADLGASDNGRWRKPA